MNPHDPDRPGAEHGRLPSPYQAPELYDLTLGPFAEDLGFWLEEARLAQGPVLEVACGTGRVLLHLLAHGIDVDGVDLYEEMLERLRVRAATEGLAPRVVRGDMRDFTMARKYRRVFLPFNGFAHCDTIDDQVRCLRCCREHLVSGGALVVHMSHTSLEYWTEPPDERVLEIEVVHPATGLPVRMYDTRTKDRVAQRQHSLVEIEELDVTGGVARTHRFETTQRWVYRDELALLLRTAGFARWEIVGGWNREPLERDDQQMLAFGWRD